jgi:hypothetical protein
MFLPLPWFTQYLQKREKKLKTAFQIWAKCQEIDLETTTFVQH